MSFCRNARSGSLAVFLTIHLQRNNIGPLQMPAIYCLVYSSTGTTHQYRRCLLTTSLVLFTPTYWNLRFFSPLNIWIRSKLRNRSRTDISPRSQRFHGAFQARIASHYCFVFEGKSVALHSTPFPGNLGDFVQVCYYLENVSDMFSQTFTGSKSTGVHATSFRYPHNIQ